MRSQSVWRAWWADTGLIDRAVLFGLFPAVIGWFVWADIAGWQGLAVTMPAACMIAVLIGVGVVCVDLVLRFRDARRDRGA